MTNPFRHFLHTRRALRDLSRIASALEALAAIARQHTPTPPQQEDLLSTGPSFSSDREQALILEYSDRVLADTGHNPTAEEIEQWLDEGGAKDR